VHGALIWRLVYKPPPGVGVCVPRILIGVEANPSQPVSPSFDSGAFLPHVLGVETLAS
jgi:hypothetical protein